MAGNENLTPKQRAKKFSSGTYTASQTGARAEAEMHMRNQMNTELQSGDSDAFERLINPGYKGKK